MAPPELTANMLSTNNGKASVVNGVYTKRAYVTFLAGNGDYVKGVVGLAKGLRKAKSAYPLVVAALPDVPEEHREILRSQGCIVREIEPIYPPENHIKFAMAYYVLNYSKLRIWNSWTAAVRRHGATSGSTLSGTISSAPNKVTWPAEMGSPPPLYFNAGMFVFEPSRLTYENLLETLIITPPTPFAEQDFLNMFFQKMYKPIPLAYNLVLAMLWRHPENVELEKVKVVHYCAAGSKPWRYTGKEANMDRDDIKVLVAKWWDIYNDKSLDFKHEDYTVVDKDTISIIGSMPEPTFLFIPTPTAA